ncbi:hypothetical protein AgCh_028243 [Apium graveolens]
MLIGTPAPMNLPVKRKRGRPRKDENLVKKDNSQLHVTPASDVFEKNQVADLNQHNDGDNNMVGKVVSGVIEACFESGYLLSVKVGNSSTLLRGVVFQPGKVSPVTPINDIAPNAKMYKRQDIPIPVVNPPIQANGSLTQSINTVENQVPVAPNQVLPPVMQSTAPFALGSSSSVGLPLNNMPKNTAGDSLPGKTTTDQNSDLQFVNESLSVTMPFSMSTTDAEISMGGVSVMPQQISDLKFENQASNIVPLPNILNNVSNAPLDVGKVALQQSPLFRFENQSPHLLKNLKMVEQDEVMQVFEAPASEPMDSIFPGTKTSNQLPPVQNQVAESEAELHQTSSGGVSQFLLSEPQTDSEPCPTETIHNDLNNSNNELLQTTVVTVPMESEYVDSGLKSSEPIQDKAADKNFNLNEASLVVEPQTVTPEPIIEPMDIVKETPVSPTKNTSPDEKMEPTEKDLGKYEASHNGKQINDVPDNTEVGSQPALKKEAALPVKPAEESDMELALVDAIPPAQSQC